MMIPEPLLEFRHGQLLSDPHDGLGLFGPVDGDSSPPGTPVYMLLGTETGIELFNQWSRAMNEPWIESPAEVKNADLWRPYPGFEAAFGSLWNQKAAFTHRIDTARLLSASRDADPYQRAASVVRLYLEGLEKSLKLEENLHVAICIVPDEVYANCRPESIVTEPEGMAVTRGVIRERKHGQQNFLEPYDHHLYRRSPDFRRQLKALAMEFEPPVQIIRESTLRLSSKNNFGERGVSPLSDRMWNLGTGLYYKAGGKPWRLASARDGVCYIGLAFRLSDRQFDGRTACCAAQMFLNDGDGVVFLGEYGPWYSPEKNEFHLDEEAAQGVLKGVLDTYRDLGGKRLTEIFLHSRSGLGPDELRGFQKSCPSDAKLVGVRIRNERLGFRLFRPGTRPVIRGTFSAVTERAGYLWGTGFKPRLGTYDGWEVPVPMRIDVQYGTADLETVATDILGLTKLNYNACRMGDASPVTIGFSDAVGEILISNPDVKKRRPQFKYYI
jgi:hypothetical protein